MIALRTMLLTGFCALPLGATESFESTPAGVISSLPSADGRWVAAPGHANILSGRGRTGKQSLQLIGGPDRSVMLELKSPSGEKLILDFWAERWTRRGTCQFSIEGKSASGWTPLKREDGVKVGGFDTHFQVEVPAGVSGLRFICSSEGGVLIDDLALHRAVPMEVTGLTSRNPVLPVLRRKPVNPVLGFTITAEGIEKPALLEAVEFSLDGTTRPQDIDRIELVPGDSEPDGKFGDPVASAVSVSGSHIFTPNKALAPGANSFWVSVGSPGTELEFAL